MDSCRWGGETERRVIKLASKEFQLIETTPPHILEDFSTAGPSSIGGTCPTLYDLLPRALSFPNSSNPRMGFYVGGGRLE